MEKKICPIMLCFNDAYVMPAGVAIWSLLKHASPEYEYPIHVVHTDITPRHQRQLRKTVSRFPHASITFTQGGEILDCLWQATTNQFTFSKDVYCKMLVGELFPQYSRMLVTDVDVLFLDDVAPLMEMVADYSEFAYAGIHGLLLPPESPLGRWSAEHQRPLKLGRWKLPNHDNDIGGGLLVANLDYLRTYRLSKEMVACTVACGHLISQAEQDVINAVCASVNIKLPLRSMICSYLYPFDRQYPGWRGRCPGYSEAEVNEALDHPVQLHYAAGNLKPWNSILVPRAWLWVRYCLRSGWGLAWMCHIVPRIPGGIVSFVKRCVSYGWRRVRRYL